MENKLEVAYKGGMGFEILARQHSITVDLSKEKGGQDSGMNPPEVFIASLGACVGVYVARYCQNANLSTEGLKILMNWKYSDDKTRISNIDVEISFQHSDIGKRANALLEVARHCLIHNTLLNHPVINFTLANGF